MPTGTNAFLLYSLFISLIALLLGFDLFVLNRKHQTIHAGKAVRQAGLWASLGLAFCAVIYWLYDSHAFGLGTSSPAIVGMPSTGKGAAALFLQGYLLELMLSLDNMMVIGMILRYFAVPPHLQHRVLFWGILGAVILRGTMIAVGSALVQSFDWVIYVFGAVLLFSAYKLFFLADDGDTDLSKNRIVRVTRAILPLSPNFDGPNFITRSPSGSWLATPLLLALIVVEAIDVVFAIDSIPAIFGITRDPFIVLTSNCFAILGLRAIYFAVAALVHKFQKLKTAMIVILLFIGIKMLLPGTFKLISWAVAQSGPDRSWSPPDSWLHAIESPYLSLTVILSIMAGGIVASLVANNRQPTN